MAQRSDSWSKRFLAWEVDWSRRRRVGSNEQVWARNPASCQRRAREWHWTTWAALRRVGVPWKPQKERVGKHTISSGYVLISKGTLTQEERELADRHDIWVGTSRATGDGQRGVKEHHLVAVKKYGALPDGFLVRHVNGDKTDNRPENLVLGTHKDNAMDHRTAVIEMMVWRERALRCEGRNVAKAISRSRKG